MSTYSATVNNSGNGTQCTYEFTLSGSHATITSLITTGVADLVIPSSLDDGSGNSGTVVSIGINALWYKQLSGDLTIPNSVTYISGYAFQGNNFNGLLTLSNSLKHIGYQAFYTQGFTGTLTIPASVTKIEDGAFLSCTGLTTITILSDANSSLYIANSVFRDIQGMNPITIPDSVTYIGTDSFRNTDLATVYMKSTNTLINTNVTPNVTYASSIGSGIGVIFYKQSHESLVQILLDETIYTVVAVADYTLSGASNITVIALDNSVTSVGGNTFADMSSLTTIQVNADHPEWGSDIGTTIDIGGAIGVSVEQHLVCFDESTLILCPSGYVPVTNLKIGDSVVTYKHGNRKISRIRVTKIVLNEELPQNVNPYKKQGYAKHMFRMKKTGDMTDDLLVTGRHGILLDDLSSCSYFVDKVFDTKIDDKILLDVGLCSRFERETECKEYTIYQIELGGDLPRYGIYANGVLMESLLSVYE